MAKPIPLADVTFVVVDIETTGGTPSQNAITEIAAVKVRGGQLLERFETLVNPQQDIPAFIQQLTGITPDMVADAPVIDNVMPGFWEFLGEGVFVAHHTAFDFRFLDAETRRLLGSGLDNEQVCTCKLARKLLPELKRKNLDSVTAHFDIEITHRHRAMGDAEATAKVLVEYFKLLEAKGITTLAKLLDYQKRGRKSYKDVNIPFPEHRLSDFSQQPGVYLMRDEKGEILYIGKAKNLRKRLKSYYANFLRLPPKVQELIPQVYDIETRILGSELEALLEESFLIKSHQPYYNRQIKNYRQFPFLKITVHDTFPQLQVTKEIENDSALYFGPYTRKRHLANMVEPLAKVFQLRTCSDTVFKKQQKLKTPCILYDIGTCSGPCAGKISPEAYHDQVREIVSFLEGQASNLTQRLVEQRDRYAESLNYEQASLVQQRLMELLKIQANTQYLAQAVHQNHLLIALPDREAHRFLLLYIFKGRPIYKQVFDPYEDSIDTVLERVRMIQEMLNSRVTDKWEVIPQAELEELRIITHWLKHGTPEDERTRTWNLTEPYSALSRSLYNFFAVQKPDPVALLRQTEAYEPHPSEIYF